MVWGVVPSTTDILGGSVATQSRVDPPTSRDVIASRQEIVIRL
jgi:hypothetical protein